MKKLIDFAKKPLLYIASSVFVLFTLILVVVSCLPRGNKYTYTMETAGVSMEVTYIFDDDDELVIETYMLGEFDKEEGEYQIKKGELFVRGKGAKEWNKVGKINAYEIVAESEEDGIKLRVVMECGLTKAIRTVSIVLMSVSGVLALASVAIVVLDKKGIIKVKEAVAAEETVEAPAVEETVEAPVVEEVAETPAEEPKTEE